jgi:hypothetical protein
LEIEKVDSMKAMMSDKLRDLLNHPRHARELQKELSSTGIASKIEKHETASSNAREGVFNNLLGKFSDRNLKNKK